MIKKTLAALMAMIILGGLAYYSGVLYSEKTVPEEQADIKAPGAIFLDAQLSNLDTIKKWEMEFKEEKELQKQEVSTQGEQVQAETKEYLYYLMGEDGYVNIYLADRKTIYEYTDIPLEILPLELQSEILEGKGISSEGELYDFLENYSS